MLFSLTVMSLAAAIDEDYDLIGIVSPLHDTPALSSRFAVSVGLAGQLCVPGDGMDLCEPLAPSRFPPLAVGDTVKLLLDSDHQRVTLSIQRASPPSPSPPSTHSTSSQPGSKDEAWEGEGEGEEVRSIHIGFDGPYLVAASFRGTGTSLSLRATPLPVPLPPSPSPSPSHHLIHTSHCLLCEAA